VVYGAVSAYLNPTLTDAVSDAQVEEVEKNIRYQMMALMRSGVLEKEVGSIEFARYLSPIVVINDNNVKTNADSPYLHFTQTSDASGMTVTQSILIIAACFAVIGAVGMVLTIKMLFRQEEEYYSTVKQQQTVDDDDSMIPQASAMQKHSSMGQFRGLNDTNQLVELGLQTSSRQSLNGQSKVQPQESCKASSRENDWGTNANMSATMRRAIITKKVPVAKVRSGDMINLGSVMEEDDEEVPALHL
jgi:hypothetical protein